MSGVRVLVGTRKGAFVLTSDGKRAKWDVSGPHFAGWEMYHIKGSPADPNRLYASQTSGWFGQIIQRSDDGGKTWHQPGTPPGEPAPGPGDRAVGAERRDRVCSRGGRVSRRADAGRCRAHGRLDSAPDSSKAQRSEIASDLGLHVGADDGNRTRTVSLGS